MKPIHVKRAIDTLAMDTTEHCNARCVFCFNDWSKHKPANIKPEEMERILPLLEHVKDEGFYLSCLFEPTLNPDFFTILKHLPQSARPKTFFTTNLVRPLSDEELEILCQANVDHINISLETFDPELYTKLTKVQKTSFYTNLERLGTMAQKYGTKIRLITMIMKDNYDELPSLVEKAHEIVHPWQHELRTPMYTKGDPAREKATEDELLSAADLADIRSRLEKTGYNLIFDTRWDRDFYLDWKAKELEKLKQRMKKGLNGVLPQYVFRIYAGGNGVIEDLHETFDWRKTRNLEKFVLKKLAKIVKEEGKLIEKTYQKSIAADQLVPYTPLQANLDKIEVVEDKWMEIYGWAADHSMHHAIDDKAVLIVENNGKTLVYGNLEMKERPDVAAALQNDFFNECGFAARISLNRLKPAKGMKFHLGFEGENGLYKTIELGSIAPEEWQ